MLNFYYWYSIITGFILTLYLIPLSHFNSKIDILLLFLIILSIILSIFLGIKNKNKFIYKEYTDSSEKKEYLPLLIIIILSTFEFLYVHDIPFFSVTINNVNSYQEFETIPFLHVFISMISLYYSIKYFYKGISLKKNNKKNICSYIIINIIMVLYNMRSFFMISFFMAVNLLIAKLRKNKKIRIKHAVIIIVIIPVLMYFFGGYGNMRQGYDWDDSSYIKNLGLYYQWPSYLPKQYMWSYSYITSPLANLNYNVSNNKKSIDTAYIYEFLPASISKRMPGFKNKNTCKLIKSYFNVSTGFCATYANGGYLGLIIFWFAIMLFPIFIFKYSDIYYKNNNYIICLTIYGGCVAFMFFDNMFSYGGTSPALWLACFVLFNKIKLKLRKGDFI